MSAAAYTTHLITEMLAKEHPDVTYMKKEEISLVLSRSLCQTYLTKPKDPMLMPKKLIRL